MTGGPQAETLFTPSDATPMSTKRLRLRRGRPDRDALAIHLKEH
ncbi:hypothetical protein V1Y59_00545 [Gordonia sp. PKS22-38]|uniref:Uncharacterized protein n=1 Tax=Gordonia prachuapensis TaxID=3115651 RepID=A0ABU7MMJ3_9ACTN|nr:hypothetical protein [Gordonia sp. PKS22-38]